MSPATSHRRLARRGMTLIEVLVAITIFGLVTTIVFGGFSQTMRNKEAVERMSDRSHAIRVVLERMVREIQSAYVSMHVNRNPALITINTCFIGGSATNGDRLDFTSFSHRRLYRNAHESDQNELSYFITNNPEERSRYVLARREANRIDDDPQNGGTTQVLLENAEELEFEYFDSVNQEWLDRWDTNGQQIGRLPLQVKIRLTVADPERGRSRVYATRAQPMITWAVNHAVYIR